MEDQRKLRKETRGAAPSTAARWAVKARFVASLFGLFCLGGARPTDEKKPTDDPALPRQLRPLIRYGMENHGDDLLQLMAAVTLLQYDAVEEAAGRISDEAVMVEGSREIPAEFIQLQGKLHRQAKALAQAAKRRDDARLGVALGEMVQVCVACHGLYLPRATPRAAPSHPAR